MRRFSKYLLAALLPLGVLLARPSIPALVLTLGQEIRLETEPFDPRDIFRGDYVELRFAIETVPADLMASRDFAGVDVAVRPAWLYVALESGEDGIFRPVRLTKEPPSEGVYIRGRIPPRRWGRRGEDFHLDYGNSLRRFYVKENTGLALEEAARRGDVVAVAKVWKGRIVLESVRPVTRLPQ